ncbi:MAG: radical SAM protein [Methanotrichaceae archaeon]|nr:radical SAM protein [Methanotrichaceae archaeon]
MYEESYAAKLNSNTARLWKAGGPLLVRLDLELTERCNNNCIHCFINRPSEDLRARENELSTDKLKKVLEEAASLGCLTVRFTGGEPLLREDFSELYVFARRLGLRVLLFTNATLITPSIANLFKQIPPLEKIEVTVFGMKKRSYEAISRNSGSFEAAFKGMKLLHDDDVPFVVKGVLLPQNIEEIDEFAVWASHIRWMDRPPTYSLSLNQRCSWNERRNRLIRSLRLPPEKVVEVLKNNRSFVPEMKQFCSRFMAPPGDKLFACGSGQNSCCLDAYGFLYPCLLLKHPDTAYDFHNGSIRDALTRFFPQIRRMKATNPEYLNRCARCFLKGLCDQCPAHSSMEHKGLDVPVEYLCRIAHLQAEHLGLLAEGEPAWEVDNWKHRVEKICQGRDG